MLPASSVIKQNARKRLASDWCRCIGASLVPVLGFAFSVIFFETVFEVFYPYIHAPSGKLLVSGFIIALIVVALTLIIMLPLLQGTVRWFWFFCIEKERPLGEIFYYYSEKRLFVRSLSLGLRLIFKIAVLAVACYLPAVLVWSIANGTFYTLSGYSDAESPRLLLPLLWVFAALSTLLLIKLSVRYFVAPVIMAIDDNIDEGEAIALSVTVSERYKNAYFKIFFAFIGWVLLSLLGITMLYTLPFLFVSYAVFCRYAINAYRTDCCEQGQKPAV